MFGKNETEHLLKDHDGLSLDVVDVFPTLQGEGPHAGRPATFIRLGGCHLKCFFCDTDFTSNRKVMSVFELAAKVEEHDHQLVVLTGGEPMRQNVVPLCEALAVGGYTVQIETAGSFWPQGLYAKRFEALVHNGDVDIVVSPKLASVHEQVGLLADAWKYIVSDEDQLGEDGLPLTGTQEQGRRVTLARPPADFLPERIYLQPCDLQDKGLNAASLRRCVALCLHHGYRLSLQQHKILGMP